MKNLVGTNPNRPKEVPPTLLITSGGLPSLVSAVGSKKRIQHSTATNFLTKKKPLDLARRLTRISTCSAMEDA